MRIKIVQDLKSHIKNEEVLYSILSHLVSQEDSFNEEWFDVFLYYALVGLCKSRPTIRKFSLKILNTISKHNAEGILDVTEKVKAISNSQHWEVKAQCMLFACNILRYLKGYSYLMKSGKDDAGGEKNLQVPNSRAGAVSSEAKIDRAYAKQLISDNLDIMRNCFGANVPMSVQRIGLFECQDILNDYKALYRPYIETFLKMEPDIRAMIFNEGEGKQDEEIYFSLGENSDIYMVRSNPQLLDKLSMLKALSDLIIDNELENLQSIHIELIAFFTDQEMDSKQHETWFKVFSKLKEYLFVAICDTDLYELALKILLRFFSTEQLKFQIFEDSQKIFPKTLQVLYDGEAEICKETFKKFVEDIIENNEDPALTNFLKSVVMEFKEHYPEVFQNSNLLELAGKLSS